MQEMTFIFDTGSAWTWIPSSDCPKTECTRGHYFYHRSTGFRSTGTNETIVYGIGKVKGYVVNDDISLTKSTKTQAKDVNFLNVFTANKLSGLKADGLLGLSPKTTRSGADTSEKVHLLVTELKKDGIVDKAMFAVFLGDVY